MEPATSAADPANELRPSPRFPDPVHERADPAGILGPSFAARAAHSDVDIDATIASIDARPGGISARTRSWHLDSAEQTSVKLVMRPFNRQIGPQR
jgi:hypothetical protein